VTVSRGGAEPNGATGHAPASRGTTDQPDDEERNVKKSFGVAIFVSALIVAGAVAAQSMLVDATADKVIAKYQAASCDQLKAQKSEPPTEKEKIALDLLRDDPKARVAFVDKIAAPVLNKMFECSMIP
jgi:cytochrome c-type biogenesis protein CcmH/NrfG